MRAKPDFWNDQDEFTRARRAKVLEHLMDFVEELKKTAPKPKDLPRPDFAPRDRDDE
jgi:hypothetical protein